MRNKQASLLYRWFDEVWNKDDENAIEQLMTADALAHGIGGEDAPIGAEGFRQFFKNFRSQFHNVRVEVEDVIAEDDIESARTMVSAINTQTNKPVTFSGICMIRVTGGKIAEAWNNY